MQELADDYLTARDEVRELALEVAQLPQMSTAEQVMAPLAPRSPGTVAEKAARVRFEADEPLTLAQAINAGLAAVLERHSNALLFGEDVAVKGGVYGVTRGLHARFGAGRVFDTLLDETSILGLALGAAVSGFLPIPEIQYLAYLHNAEDQLRGRGGHAAVLLATRVSQRDGDPARGLRLPARFRRPLPQRRRRRSAAGHTGARDRVALTAG